MPSIVQRRESLQPLRERGTAHVYIVEILLSVRGISQKFQRRFYPNTCRAVLSSKNTHVAMYAYRISSHDQHGNFVLVP